MCAILNGPWGLEEYMGHVYVASFGSDQILVFSQKGEFLDALGGSDTLDSPEGITVSPDGWLFVASFLDSRIVSFNLNDTTTTHPAPRTLAVGTPVDMEYLNGDYSDYTLEREKHGRTSFLHGPEDVLFADGMLLVSSHYNNSVLALDPSTGTIEAVFQGPIEGPMGLALDRDKHTLFVTSYRSKSVTRFDVQTGEYTGIAVRDPHLLGPSSMTLLEDGSMLVAAYEASALLLFNCTAGWARMLVLEGGRRLARIRGSDM
eukprot:CAMPEP_0185747046 /NCGR_PEP_ID=MMETSP1174-20130828/5723_1 /TAXON_ID=35687 /ORGANISM="Dictyocha speculum, Strain CCMP1381" /LENGTH=259 /DNA_ID=CAMNT_0028422069 /DNA_START=377 /DNA_END=1156 /DNA_ORIENTATION=+